MLPASPKISTVWREPFGLGSPIVEIWPFGKSIQDAINAASYLPENFASVGTVSINGHIIPREIWNKVYPAPSKSGKPVIVTLQVATQGGREGGGGKQIFAFVAALGLTLLTGGIAGGSLQGLLGAKFAAGTAGALRAAAAVSVVGGLVINALTSAPMRAGENGAGSPDPLNPASLNGNVLSPNTPLPFVIGTRKIFPPFISEPIVELIGQNEIVSGIMALAGPHHFDKIRVGDALASDDETGDLVIKTYDALPGSKFLDIPERYGKTFQINTEMSIHGVKSDDGNVYAGPLPVFHSTATAESPDETWLHFLVSGLIKDDIPDNNLRVPFRIRLRKRGETVWRNLPELHYMDIAASQRRIQIKLIFGAPFISSLPAPSTVRGWIAAIKETPAGSLEGSIWAADSYFSGGAGDDLYDATTNTTTNVRNVLLVEDTVLVYLDYAEWSTGIYDIQVKRGAVFRDDQFDPVAYEYNGNVRDFFDKPHNGNMFLSRERLLDRITLIRSVNVKYRSPVNTRTCALIHLQATNRQVDEVSVIASAYVRDYDGTAWNNLVTTSNPAAHFRSLLTGPLNAKPLPEGMIWEENLIEWRQFCIDNNLTCDLVVEGAAIDEVKRIVASCGQASPYQSDVYGVITDYDRSAEPPEQTFSARNMNNYEIRKVFPDLPSGLRPNFKDEEYEYAGKQIVVYADDVFAPDNNTEQIEYLGIVDRAKIINRAKFDLRQMRLRSGVHSFDTNVGILACRRGSLIAVNEPTITGVNSNSCRISEVVRNTGGDVIGVVLDAPIEVFNSPYFADVVDFASETDVSLIGLKTGIAISNRKGLLTRHGVSNVAGTTSELTLDAPITVDADDYVEGNLIVSGMINHEYRRLIVTDIKYSRGIKATVTAVNEAPELWPPLPVSPGLGWTDGGLWDDGEMWDDVA